MKIQARDLDAEAMKGIGNFVTPREGAPPDTGVEFTFELAAGDLGMPPGLCAGRLECLPRALRVAKLERHLKSPELLSAVEGDAVVAIAPPQEAKNGRLEDLRAVIVRKGQALVLEPGSWHWIPFPLGQERARFLVVFRRETGADDLDFCQLAEAGDIVLEGGK